VADGLQPLSASIPEDLVLTTVNSINTCNPVEHARITVLPGISHNDIEQPIFDLSALGEGQPQYDAYDQGLFDWLLEHERI
jgi:hypothetical protein